MVGDLNAVARNYDDQKISSKTQKNFFYRPLKGQNKVNRHWSLQFGERITVKRYHMAARWAVASLSTGAAEAEKAAIVHGPGRDECERVVVIERREEFRIETLFKDIFVHFCAVLF